MLIISEEFVDIALKDIYVPHFLLYVCKYCYCKLEVLGLHLFAIVGSLKNPIKHPGSPGDILCQLQFTWKF